MALTANAWVSAEGAAIIDIWSSDGWSDPNWKIAGSLGDFPDSYYTSLYQPWTQSGVGTINGSTLNVIIDQVPEGVFALTTQNGVKNFQLIEGELVLGRALLGVKNVNIRTYEAETKNPWRLYDKALVFFSDKLQPFRGRVTAQLQKDGELHATLGGNAVDTVNTLTSTANNWSVPAVLFHEFYWHKVPTERTSYTFVFKEERRTGSSSKLVILPVDMDLLQVYSPVVAPGFIVAPDHQFELSLAQSLEVRRS